MKILLRRHDDEQYVWKTAKYDGEHFRVNDETIMETNIVSIVNDNRKNYVLCSSCGKMFPKNGIKFKKHQNESATLNPCLNCNRLHVKCVSPDKRRFVFKEDGTCVEKIDRNVDLVCSYGLWHSFYIDSQEALDTCKFRQCASAHPMEINDIFTEYPGVFDDIITIDTILDNGYETILYSDRRETSYFITLNNQFIAYVNSLGIVDRFSVEVEYCFYTLWYSKRYSKVFTCDDDGHYQEWRPNISEEKIAEVTNCITELYK